MSSSSRGEIQQLHSRLQTLLNKQLQNICQLNGLKTSGVKADLQRRILNALYENVTSDPASYVHLKDSINNIMGGSGRGGASSSGSHPPQGNGSSSAGYGRAGTYSNHMSHGSHVQQSGVYNNFGFSTGQSQHDRGGYGGGASAAVPSPPGMVHIRQSPLAQGLTSHPALQFNPSPFYKVEQLIGTVRTLEVMTQHRNSATIQLKTNETPALSRCAQDKNLRVLVFCAGDENGLQDISFPHQSELKVNGGDIKANLRGLKGKAGSTRPVDITDSLRLDKYSYVNNIEFTYALTNKVKHDQKNERQKFFLALFLCHMSPVDELATKVKARKIPKASVIKELTKAAHDPDVVATSQVLSLKCPLTYMRLKNPARSTTCLHIQCFDITSYLHLQEQGPQWICPICNKPAAYDNLAIDEYVKDILDRTRDSTEQVTIEPDGQWRTEAPEEPEPKRPRISGASLGSVRLDDDDVISLDDFGVVSSCNTQTPSRSMLGTRTPSVSRAGMNGSSTPNGVAGSSRKRTAEVIDLTLSDSEDDAPPPTKRQNTGVTPTPGPEWSFPAPFQN